MSMSPTASDAIKSNLGQGGDHTKPAASAAGEAIKGASAIAGDELRLGKAQVKSELADSALAGIAAAENLGDAAREQMDVLMDKSRDVLDSASELIRERPLTAFGIAFAAGWLIAKVARSGNK